MHETHTEKIKCPDCGTIQDATVEHTTPFYTYLHNCEKCNFTIMESDWEVIMHETKQNTAMTILRDRLQKVIDIEPSGTIEVIIKQIDTELLAVEKQQHIDTFNAGYREGEHDGINTSSEEKDIAEFSNATVYFNSTFNTK